MKRLFILLITLFAISCIQGTVADSITITKTVSFPPVPIPITGMISTSTDVDLSSLLSSLDKLGSVSLEFQNSQLSDADLSWVKHVGITITSNDGSVPEDLLTSFDVATSSHVLYLPIKMDEKELLLFLRRPCQLHFFLDGTLPTSGEILTYSLTVKVSIGVDKSISDIGK